MDSSDARVSPHDVHAFLSGSQPSTPSTLRDIFLTSVAAHPDAPALVGATECLTYERARELASELAERLNSGGIGPGSRVGVCLPTGATDLYLTILGIIMAGASYVPVDFEDGTERRELVFSSAEVSAVIDVSGLSFRAGSRSTGRLPADLTLDDEAYVIFTSGTTGAPKGVSVSYRSIGIFLDGEDKLLCVEQPLGPKDRVLAGLSVGFDSSVEEMWLAWKHGAALVPASRDTMRSGPDLAAFLQAHGISVVSTVPSLARFLAGHDLPQLRLLILGGEAVTPDLVDALATGDREVWNSYGPTECTVGATFERMVPGEPIYIGQAVSGTTMAVIDETGQQVSDGVVGELVITGYGLGRYLDEALDRERFRPLTSLNWDRAYFTGDFVRLEREGLSWVGRRDDQVKVAGRRLELGEVEAAALGMPGVSAAAALVASSSDGAKRLVCYVSGNESLDSGVLARELATKLPAGVVPKIVVVGELPLTASGKVDKGALAGIDPAIDTSTLDGIDDPVLRAWSRALGTTDISDTDGFFDLGGSSVAAAQVIVELRDPFPMCSVSDLYSYPTLGSFRERIESLSLAQASTADVASPLRPATQAAQAVLVPFLLAFQSLRWLAGILVAIAIVDSALLPPGWLLTTVWLAAAMLLTPARVLVTAVIVRLITLPIRGEVYRRGGAAHLALWAAQRIVVTMGVAEVAGTSLMNVFARVTGCRLGRGVTLGSLPPVTGRLSVGDQATIEPGVRWVDWITDGDRVQLASYECGAGSRIGAKAAFIGSTEIGPGAEVCAHTLVTGDVPENAWASGSPMTLGTAAADNTWPDSPPRSGGWWALAYFAGLLFASSLTALSLLPDFLIFETYAPYESGAGAVLWWVARWSLGLALIGVVSYAAVFGLALRWLGRRVPAGVFPAASAAGVASWLVELLGSRSIPRLITIHSTLLTPYWYRLIGVTVGRGVECSTLVGQYNHIAIADHAFMADNPGLAQRETHRGWVRVSPVSIGEWSFIGNQAYILSGSNLPSRSSLGVSSEMPVEAHSRAMYFGAPAIEFPLLPEYDLSVNPVIPTWRQRCARAAFELLRVVPLAVLLIIDTVIGLAIVAGVERYSLIATVGIGALALFVGTLVSLLLTASFKWLAQGRVRPGSHPFWSPFVWRSEFMWAVVSVLALPWMETVLPGTPYVVWYHRLMGARFGRGIWCECLFISEHDNVVVGDGVTLGPIADLQTHMFAGHNLITGEVTVGEGASIGGYSHVLVGATVGAGARVTPNSVVPRGEVLPAGSAWWGHPAVPRG